MPLKYLHFGVESAQLKGGRMKKRFSDEQIIPTLLKNLSMLVTFFSRCDMIKYRIRKLFSCPNLNVTHKTKGNFTAQHPRTGGLIHIDCVYSDHCRTLNNKISINVRIKKPNNFITKKNLATKICIRFINCIL